VSGFARPTGDEEMSTQRIGTTEGMDTPGMKVVPIISLAVVHNGIVNL
jgi:hypothetical protein